MITMHFGNGSVCKAILWHRWKAVFSLSLLNKSSVSKLQTPFTTLTVQYLSLNITKVWGQADLWNIIRIAPNLASARLRTELWASFKPWNKLGTGRPTQSFQVTWPKLCECNECPGGLSIWKLWGILALFSQSLRNNSSQSWGSNKAILFPNRSLNFYITPLWELQSGNETCGGSHFFWKCEVRTTLTITN